MKVSKLLNLLLVLLIITSPLLSIAQTKGSAQTNQTNNQVGISIFNFVEKIAGNRNFSATIVLTFDVLDNNERKVTKLAFNMDVTNLERFTFDIQQPKILEGIKITYDLVSRKTEYRYGKIVLTEPQTVALGQTASLVQSITDFLSTPLFDVKETPTEILFTPKNAAFLARFGVLPIKVSLKLNNGLPSMIKIFNDKTDEKITIEFSNFSLKNSSNPKN
ncbi:hypothetical protein [Fervidobacterium thailandense]|uniref:Uncharacterized protein n=1 Tax=Fervidobacterium thailandense TaxID=1008305 RepID=A0A1E3G0E7_9BACT|nr:hypothetical protein [Fervidobacterium thailandense]ODN29744.1 hypothetical protein A4H02_09200 [Fervidobacterium thailandense]